VHPADLSAVFLTGLAERASLDPAVIDDVVWGVVAPVGDQAFNLARTAVLAAGWPESVPGATVDRQCGSSQQAVHFAAAGLISGQYDVVVAGGVGARKFLAMRSMRPAYAMVVIVPALLLAWGTGRFPPALGAEASLYDWPNTVAELQTATAAIPADAPVSADDGLAVWLANRHTINDFPDRLDSTCYVVLDKHAYLSGPTNPAQRQAMIDLLPTSGRRLLYEDARFQVWSPVGD